MNLQPDLFGAPPVNVYTGLPAPPEPRTRARRDDPATSKDAAASLGFAAQHHAAIVQAMRDYGARGLTVHEIAAYCRLDAHAIGKRIGELETAGIVQTTVVPDGDSPDGYAVQTRKTPSGRRARVWFLARADGNVLRSTDGIPPAGATD